jgi:hypothetical protein
MEQEMIHYLSFDLTIPGSGLGEFTQTMRATYKPEYPRPHTISSPINREKTATSARAGG